MSSAWSIVLCGGVSSGRRPLGRGRVAGVGELGTSGEQYFPGWVYKYADGVITLREETGPMSPTVDRPEPPYLQIAKRLREQIRSGELRDGDMVPSTRKLAAEWNVSGPTAAKALTMLQSEGLVRGVAGVGTVVCAGVTARNSSLDRLRSIWATGRIYPPNEHAEIKSASLVPAPPEIAGALGLAAGTYVIRRHRVTYRDDVPISASVTWLDGKLAGVAPLLLTTERLMQGTIGYIRESHRPRGGPWRRPGLSAGGDRAGR